MPATTETSPARDLKPDRKRPATIARRTIVVMTAFTVFLMIGICIVADLLYVKVKVDDRADIAFNYTRSAANFIDGDRLAAYAAGEKPDDYYYEVQHYLSSLLTTSELDYFYVLVPTPEHLIYIWDPPRDEHSESFPLGHTLSYLEGFGYDRMLELFSRTDECAPIFSTDESGDDLITTLTPIYDSKGNLAGLATTSIIVRNLGQELIGFMAAIAIAIAVMVTLLTIFLYIYTKKHIIAPLSQLNQGTKKLVSSLDSGTRFRFDIHTGDEIEELATSFTSMHDELNDYLKALAAATAEKERIATELSVATSIQASMLPKLSPEFAARPDFKIFASMDPAKEVGGDFYDAFLIDPGHLAIVIADVSGKGVPAALFMVISKTLIKLRTQLSGSLSPGRIFATVNNQLIESNDAGMFVTAWLGIIDLATGRGRASNAGHEHPVLCRNGEHFALVEYEHSPPLGCIDDIAFEEHEFKLNPGDNLFIYTDGVAEAVNSEGVQFDTDRLVTALNAHPGLDPSDLVPAVRADLDRFVGEAEQFDDITMLAFKYLGTTQNSGRKA